MFYLLLLLLSFYSTLPCKLNTLRTFCVITFINVVLYASLIGIIFCFKFFNVDAHIIGLIIRTHTYAK